jgi:hypothetical protein
VALYGVSELAEIAALCNAEVGLELVVVAPGAGARALGLAAFPDLAAAGAVDAVIVTDLARPQSAFAALAKLMPPDRVLTPALLRIRRNGAS